MTMVRVKGPYLTFEEVRRALNYDAETGILTWRIAPTSSIPAGTAAATKRSNGYMELQYQNRLYKAHRLVWLYMTGEWAEPNTIDHINRDRSDNRWENLRRATRKQQAANRVMRSSSGVKGVYREKARRHHLHPYRVSYYIDGHQKYGGHFATLEEAAATYARLVSGVDPEFRVFHNQPKG